MPKLAIPRSNPSVVRAMADQLCAERVDLSNAVEVISVLLGEGWRVSAIEEHMEDAILMATIRNRNNRRRP